MSLFRLNNALTQLQRFYLKLQDCLTQVQNASNSQNLDSVCFALTQESSERIPEWGDKKPGLTYSLWVAVFRSTLFYFLTIIVAVCSRSGFSSSCTTGCHENSGPSNLLSKQQDDYSTELFKDGGIRNSRSASVWSRGRLGSQVQATVSPTSSNLRIKT